MGVFCSNWNTTFYFEVILDGHENLRIGACSQHSQNANFYLNFKKYYVKILYGIIDMTECVWEFQNNALWDTH